MDLQLLRAFVVTAEEEHVGRAAQRLHISQSPLSRQIQRLEAELGLPLFERAKQRLRLTEEGRRFLAEARGLLAHSDAVKESARRMAHGEEATLTIGYVQAALQGGLLVDALRRFRRIAASAAIRLYPMRSAAQLEALRRGTLDIAFTHTAPAADDLCIRLLGDDPFVVALPQDHPLAVRPSLSSAGMGEVPWIALDRNVNPDFRARFLESCADLGFVPDIRYETVDVFTALALVSAGLGVALVHSGLLMRPPEGVVFRDLPGLRLSVPLHAVWRKASQSLILDRFLAHIAADSD